MERPRGPKRMGARAALHSIMSAMRILRRAAAAQGGAVALEFALALPLFIMLFFGVVEFGLIMHAKGVITQASREGARYGLVYSLTPQSNADIQNFVFNYLAGLGVSDITLGNIQVSGAGGPDGATLSVQVNYTYHFLVLPNFIAALTGNLNLSAGTVMLRE